MLVNGCESIYDLQRKALRDKYNRTVNPDTDLEGLNKNQFYFTDPVEIDKGVVINKSESAINGQIGDGGGSYD